MPDKLQLREKALHRAENKLMRAVRLLHEAAEEMSEGNQQTVPVGACGNDVSRAAGIVETVLEKFPTASA